MAFWERAIREAGGRGITQLVATDDGRVVGFATFGPARPEDARVGELYAIYVDPDRWGAGYGRALIAAAERGLREAGYAQAVLWVLASNARSRRFYEIAGWAADGATRTEHAVWGREVELREARYRKRLVA